MEDNKRQAFLNACDCLKYGFGKKHWNSCGITEEEANKVWLEAIKEMEKDS